MKNIFNFLRKLNTRPEPYSAYTAQMMWDDAHVSASMLALHLDGTNELASRPVEFIERSVEWIDERLGLDGLAVCDFGCGPGLYANRFAERGARVTGLDFSSRSLGHARKVAEERGLVVDYRDLNYLEFSPDRAYDLITMIYGDFCALNPQQRARLMAIWRESLAEGGCVLMDVFSTEHFRDVAEVAEYSHNQAGFWSGAEHFEFRTSFRYEDLDLALFRHVIIEPLRSLDIFNWLHYYTPETLEEELAANGFAITARFAGLTGAPARECDRDIAVFITAAN